MPSTVYNTIFSFRNALKSFPKFINRYISVTRSTASFFLAITVSLQKRVFNKVTLWVLSCFAWLCKNLFSKSVFKFLTSDYILGTWMMEVFLVIHGMFKKPGTLSKTKVLLSDFFPNVSKCELISPSFS